MQPSVRRRTFVSIAAGIGIGSGGGLYTGRGSAAETTVRDRWSREYGADGSAFRAVTGTDDGYVVAGRKQNEGWIVKLDEDGTADWTVTTGEEGGSAGFEDVVETAGGYVACGVVEGDTRRGWLVGVDDTGTVRWNRTIDSRPGAFGGVTYHDGQTVAVGTALEEDDGWIVAVDAEGEIDWEDLYGPSGSNAFNAAVPDGDAVAVAGRLQYATGDPSDPWLLWIDPSNGNTVDLPSIDGAGETVIQGLDRPDDGTLLAVGTANGGSDGFLARFSDRSLDVERLFDGSGPFQDVVADGEKTVVGGRTNDGEETVVGGRTTGGEGVVRWLEDGEIDATYVDDEGDSGVAGVAAADAIVAVGRRDADGGGFDSSATRDTDAFGREGIATEDPIAWAVGLERVDDPVVATFDVGTDEPTAGSPVAFDATGSSPESDIETYEWAFTAEDDLDPAGPDPEYVYEQPGEYDVTVRVRTADGREDRTTERIAVGEATELSASFSYDPEVVLVGEEIEFDAAASSPSSDIERYEWDFGGDGEYEALGPVTNRTFETAEETYSVRLRVVGEDGETDGTSTEFEILEDDELRADAFATPNPCVTGEFVTFDATRSTPESTIKTYEWEWPDGGTEQRSITSNFWMESGSYDVTLQVTDEDGETDEDVVTVDIVDLSAEFDVTPEDPDAGEPIAVDGTRSEPEDRIDTYQWDFDAEPGDIDPDKEGSDATHTYEESGTYLLTLLVTGKDGGEAVESKAIEVGEPDLEAAFTADPEEPAVGEEIAFDASDSRPEDAIESYEWTFEEGLGGGTKTGEAVTHEYEEEGRYDVTLTVTDEEGDTEERTRTIEIEDREIAPTFTVDPENPRVGEEIAFDGSESEPEGKIESYEWEFDAGLIGGETATGAVVHHEYDDPGEYDVGLTVTLEDGDSAELTETVAVADDDLVARFDVAPETPTVGETVTVDASDSEPTEAIERYEWRHTEEIGVAGTGREETFTFDRSDDVEIRLLIETEDGREDETTATITIGAEEDEDDGGLGPPDDEDDGEGSGDDEDGGDDDGGLFPDDDEENDDDGLFPDDEDGDEFPGDDASGDDRDSAEPPEEVAMPDRLPVAAAASLLGGGIAVRAYRRLVDGTDQE